LKVKRRLQVVGVMAIGLVLAFSSMTQAVERLSLATGGTAGTYYPIGAGIASIISKYVEGVEVTAEATGASVANLRMAKDGKVELLMAASNTAWGAFNGHEPFDKEPVKNIRGIAALYPEVFQFVVMKGSGLTRVSELKGKKVVVGAPGSGTERTASMILEAHGLTYKDIEPRFLSFGDGITALKDRLVDCAVIGAGIPTAAVVDASVSLDINLLEVDKEPMEKFMEEVSYFRLFTIPAGTYKGVDRDVLTGASPALLIVREDLGEEVVYKITKVIFEHLEDLRGVHAQADNISLEGALQAMSIPLHPGAEKYYKEVGLLK